MPPTNRFSALTQMQCANPTAYKAETIGNDPELSIEDYAQSCLKVGYHHFVVAGCSCLKNLSMLKDIITAAKTANTTYDVQLILIDNSQAVHDFWKLLITHIGEAKTLEDLIKNKLSPSTDAGRQYFECCNATCTSVQFIDYVKSTIGDEFEAFKKILTQNTNIVLNSWTDKPLFDALAEKIEDNSVIITYPSNIIEFLPQKEQEQLIENIEALNSAANITIEEGRVKACFACIHTRTSIEARDKAQAIFEKRGIQMPIPDIHMPDECVFVIQEQDIEAHRARLHDPKYNPLHGSVGAYQSFKERHQDALEKEESKTNPGGPTPPSNQGP